MNYRINLRYIALVLSIITPLLMIFSRGIASVVLGLVFLLFFFELLRAQRLRGALEYVQTVLVSRNGVLVFATVAYCGLSLLWTPAFSRGVTAYWQFVAFILATSFVLIVFTQVRSIEPPLSKLMTIVIALTSTLILTELWLGSPLREMVGASPEPHRLNRAAVAIAILAPVLLLPTSEDPRKTVSWLAISIAILACLFSVSESAKLAIFCGLTVWVVLRFLPTRQMALSVSSVILFSFLVAPFGAVLLYNFIPPSAYEAIGASDHFERPEIWRAYVDLIPETPIFGRGFESSFVTGSLYTGSDERLAELLGYVHPHNFSIQIWYELGIVGVLFFSALLLILFEELLKLPDDHQPVAFGMVAAMWTVAYVSHGAWQSWWWSLLGIVALLLIFMSRSMMAKMSDASGQAQVGRDQST